MKKIKSLLISLLICATLFCQVGGCFTLNAETTSQDTTKVVSLSALVHLKKILVGTKKSSANELDYDYNKDGILNAKDIVVLRRMLLGLPVDTESSEIELKFDKDGYYNKVIKP